MKAVTDKLTEDGVKLFADAFDKLLGGGGETHHEGRASHPINKMTYQLPEELTEAVKRNLDDWKSGQQSKASVGARRVAVDQSRTKTSGLAGWASPRSRLRKQAQFKKIADEIHNGRISRTPLLLGMGGSSLCVEVLEMTFGKIPGHPQMHVLDSTDPAQFARLKTTSIIAKTIFIVSSKSGSTLEPKSSSSISTSA